MATTNNTGKKKSYKNVLLTPAPFIKIMAFTSSQYLYTTLTNELLNSLHNDLRVPTTYSPLQFVLEQEEQELIDLTNPSSYSYRKLYSTLFTVANKLKVNILAVIGHVEICTDELKRMDLTVLPPNKYPNIVIVIGCHSKDYIIDFASKPELQRLNYYFLGFENLMHVIDGELYGCELPHNDVPYLECRYDNAVDDAYLLYDHNTSSYKQNEIQRTNAGANKFALCLQARNERYTTTYKEGLYKRNCSKFRAEDIVKKIEGLKNVYGDFIRPDFVPEAATVFQLSDGLHCTPQTCPMRITKQFDELNRLFDEETKYISVYQAIDELFEAYNPATRSTDEKIVSYLSGLPLKKANKVLTLPVSTYMYERIPLYYIPFLYNLRISLKEMMTKYTIDYSYRYEEQGILHMIFNDNTEYLYSLKQKFRLCLQIKDTFKGINPFNQYDYHTDSETPFVYLLKQYKKNIPLLYFYFKFFPGLPSSKAFKINYNTCIHPDAATQLLQVFFMNEKEFGSEFVGILEKLLVNGVNPLDGYTHDYENPLAYYEENAPELLNPTLLTLVCSYAWNFIEGEAPPVIMYAKKRLAYFKDVLEKKSGADQYLLALYKSKVTELKNEVKRVKKVYDSRRTNYNDEYGYNSNDDYDYTKKKDYREAMRKLTIAEYRVTNFDAFVLSAKNAFEQAASIRKETAEIKTPEDIEPELDFLLAPYMEGARAIPTVKELYTSIQKYMKKSKAKAEEKTQFLKKIADMYKSKMNVNENEGNSAYRRLQLMQDEFDAFKAKHPMTGGRKTRRIRVSKRYTRKH